MSLAKLEQQAAFGGGKKHLKNYIRSNPENKDAAWRAWESGQHSKSRLKEIARAARDPTVAVAHVWRLANQLCRERTYMERTCELQLRRALAERVRLEASPDFRIAALPHCDRWRLGIDESGSTFAQADGSRDCVVGVLAPQRSMPDSLGEGFHATGSAPATLDAAFATLRRQPQLGVLGLRTDAVPDQPGEVWWTLVVHLIAWAGSLLPLPETGTVWLRAHVEERGWAKARRDSIHQLQMAARERLARWFPERAERVELDVTIVGKDANVLLGYADLISNAWHSNQEISRARLEAARLPGPCLLEGDVRRLTRLLTTTQVAGEDWRWLVHQTDAGEQLSPAARVLAKISERSTPRDWQRFERAAAEHLERGGAHLPHAVTEVDWLLSNRPDPTQPLKPALALAWTIQRLALSNHLGRLEDADLEAELERLCTLLLDEDPALVCLADLHLAVQATNQFDFDEATARLGRWEGLPIGYGGRRMRARVVSSLGQHLAFRGQLTAAREHFSEAIEMFSRLSDPEVVARECSQTLAYLAIASMDDSALSDDAVRRSVEAVTGPLTSVLDETALGALDKYRHHVLARYLWQRGSPEERGQYLACQACWQDGAGHPWPLILTYRALILHPTQPRDACELLEVAWTRAHDESQGPVVWMQGAVIAAIANQWGLSLPGARAKLPLLLHALPLAESRLRAIEQALETDREPADILRDALPFNFR